MHSCISSFPLSFTASVWLHEKIILEIGSAVKSNNTIKTGLSSIYTGLQTLKLIRKGDFWPEMSLVEA